MTGHNGNVHQPLLEAAFRQALAEFRKEVGDGRRDPFAELAGYRRRRRDYATALRIEAIPDEARALARRMCETHGLSLNKERAAEFDRQVTRMLIRLYEAFIADAENARQGNR